MANLINRILNHSFIRFLLVGGLNTVFGYLMFAFFEYLTGNASMSVILSNIVGVLFNFKTYGNLVFKSSDNARIYRFVGAYLLLISLQILSLKGLARFGIANPYIAGGLIALPMAALSFVMMRKFVFHTALAIGEVKNKE